MNGAVELGGDVESSVAVVVVGIQVHSTVGDDGVAVVPEVVGLDDVATDDGGRYVGEVVPSALVTSLTLAVGSLVGVPTDVILDVAEKVGDMVLFGVATGRRVGLPIDDIVGAMVVLEVVTLGN